MPTLPLIARFQLNNPARVPDWRYQRATHLVENNLRLWQRTDDQLTRDTVTYIRTLRDAQTRTKRRNVLTRHHHIHAAFQLSESVRRINIEAQILAEIPLEEIAHRTGIKLSVLTCFCGLYFDVLDRLEAKDWVFAAVLRPCVNPNSKTAWITKTMAYFGGPLVLDAVEKMLVRGEEYKPNLADMGGRADAAIKLLFDFMRITKNPDNKTMWDLVRFRNILLEPLFIPPTPPESATILNRNIVEFLSVALERADKQQEINKLAGVGVA